MSRLSWMVAALVTLVMASFCDRAGAQQFPMVVSPGVHAFQFVGSCQLTSLAVATGLSSCVTTKPDGTTVSGIPTAVINGIVTPAVLVQVMVENAAVRYVSGGANPTSSYGMLVPATTPYQYSGPLSTVKFIQTAGGAVIDIEFFVQ